MKTSNKIFISFLIFLFGGIIALYLGSKYLSDYYSSTNFETQEKPLAPFSVVLAEPDANFDLTSGKKNKIIQAYRKGTVSDFPALTVRNDTLFVSSVKQISGLPKNYRVVPEISCVKLKSIITKENTYIMIRKFQTDTLNITMNKSRLDYRFDKVAFVSIQAKVSDIYFEGKKLEKLVVKLDKTELRTSVKKRIDNLAGSLKNHSNCTFYMSNNISLDTDKTSKYDFYMYK